jgi:hypothetical protein
MTVLTPIKGADLVAQLEATRSRVDRATQLMQWSIDLREQLTWGVLDIDAAREEVAAYKRAVEQHERGFA